jgi:hypothetical protein
MAISIHGEYVPDYLDRMPCGGMPWFDDSSGCAYRCDTCFAVVGSVGQPKICKNLNMHVAHFEYIRKLVIQTLKSKLKDK